MSYFSNEAELRFRGIEPHDGYAVDDQAKGCIEPTHGYGKAPGVRTFEEGVQAGVIKNIPEQEWPDWIEYLEKNSVTLHHRIDNDWVRALTQGRLGYCWAYAVGGAMQANDSRDGILHVQLSCASVAAQIKGGRDQGGWPVDAASFISTDGICKLSTWGDCSCRGSSCKGTRGGCPARDLSKVEGQKQEALERTIKTFFEVPRDDFAATMSCVLQGIPVAAGWVGHGNLWCNNHAMNVLSPIRTNKKGYQLVPDNSWGSFKRRVPVSVAPTGGVAIVSNTIKGEGG